MKEWFLLDLSIEGTSELRDVEIAINARSEMGWEVFSIVPYSRTFGAYGENTYPDDRVLVTFYREKK